MARIVVIGGCGTVGSIAVQTLAKYDDFSEIIVADLDYEGARTCAEEVDTDKCSAVLVDATNGKFKEASWVHEPVKYLTISKTDALDIVFDWLIDHGYNPDELNSREIQIDLVYRDSTPYYPDWRVAISELGLTFFVSQDGVIT